VRINRVADAIIHPVRLRIVQALDGRELTTRQLQASLGDVPQASLYRHVALLVEHGLVRVTGERAVRGGTERTYTAVASAVRLGPEAFADAGPDDHRRWFATFVGSLLAAFERLVDTGGLDRRSPLRYEQNALWLTDAEALALATTLSEAIEPLRRHEPGHGRRRLLLSTTLFADVDQDGDP
jgi:DNA-binding transcriptional ArsR family regulator